MTVIDSSCWLEFFAGTKYAEIISDVVRKPLEIIIPTIIITEIYKKISNEKDSNTAFLICSQLKKCRIVNLDFDLAVLAAELGKKYKLALADSIIYASAKKYSADLYTLDAHFEGLDNVKYFSKKNP